MGSRLEADVERAYWERADEKTKQALRAIREFVDFLEKMKKEVCLESARLSGEETVTYIGPGTEVALAGISHAVDYLALCRSRILDTDLVLSTRALIRLDRD